MIKLKPRYYYIFKKHFLRNQFNTFCVSFLIGILLACFTHEHHHNSTYLFIEEENPVLSTGFEYTKWLKENYDLESSLVDPDLNRYTYVYNESNEADFLYRKISVTCLILPFTELGAITVAKTWGKRCNHLHFVSRSLKNDTIPIVKMLSKSAFHLLCQSFHKIIRDGSDWYFLAYEDTFALLTNLRYFVAYKNSNETHYLGHAMKFWNVEYNWFEGGIILSRGSLVKLLNKYSDSEKCAKGGKHWKNSDWYLGKNLREIGIKPVDTRDKLGRGRFNGHPMIRMLFPGGISFFDKYWKNSIYLSEDGPHCCSNYAITFYGITSKSKMYQLDYMFHRLRPFYGGGVHGNKLYNGTKLIKDLFLTQNEKLKEEYLSKFLENYGMLTTPASFNKMMKADGPPLIH